MQPYTEDVEDVIEKESNYIGKRRSDRRVGLAYSGGGIRSASFGMGVMQALVREDHLKEVDYLSTVSGGGYLGSSLTWFLSQIMPDETPFGTHADNFPFGKRRQGSRTGNTDKPNAILDFIRQHGNYLIPGSGLSPLSFFAITMRTILISFAVYFALATGLLSILLQWVTPVAAPALVPDELFSPIWIKLSLVLGGIWAVTAALYSLCTFFKMIRGARYRVAIFVQRFLGWLTYLILIFVVLSLVSLIHENMQAILVAVGLRENVGQDAVHAGVSSLSTIIGALMAALSHRRQMQSDKGASSMNVITGAILLLFGIFYGAYVAGSYIATDGLNIAIPGLPVLGLQGAEGSTYLLAVSVFFGVICNVNYFGLNRMYRDRLMETFMPNISNTETGFWGPATDANSARLEDMCSEPNQRPYHLVNCNIVLTGSTNAKYRGRKGDSFTLSPLYCGSDATGWRTTDTYMHNRIRTGLTLPTAMAISGAAANPNAGVGGRGATTNQFLSALMSLMNLRLGFWADNPKFAPRWWTLTPNYLYPGIKGAISRCKEDARAIELTDGGHFEDLGIYELLRRNVDLIIVSDAGADGDYTFSDLANAVERSRVDFGVKVVFLDPYSLQGVVPDSDTNQSEIQRTNYHLAERGFAIAEIQYATKTVDEKRQIGHLVYIKPTLVKGLSADVLGYKRQNPTFPHQSTLDQFFDEQQFEAYRELGYELGKKVLEDEKVIGLLKNSTEQEN